MRLSPIAVQCIQITVICTALLTGVILSDVSRPAPESYLGKPCVPCEWDDHLRAAMSRGLVNASVVIAQEVGDPCCALVGYDDADQLHWCLSPALLTWGSPYNTLQDFHCGERQLFKMSKRVQFECGEDIVEIKNPVLAGAYSVAFALMDGFNCS